MKEREILQSMVLPEILKNMLEKNQKKIIIPETREELFELAMGGEEKLFEVAYDVPEKGRIVECTVANCKNGASVNYVDPYMRRRDPNCMYIADDLATDKPRFEEKFGEKFDQLRQDTFDWLENEDLIVMPFMSGGSKYGYESLLVAPANAGFFAAGLWDLQESIPMSKVRTDGFKPIGVLYLAPTFRHTYFEGKQIVVHNRLNQMHEEFCYNLYPGPSAKKGVYGILLNIGEREGWVTAHTSACRIVTPYKNKLCIMHEGASGGGKSEMLEPIHRQQDGRIRLGTSVVDGEKIYVEIHDESEIEPVADDMALCHPSIQDGKRLALIDAEYGWFLRVNHIQHYGTDPYLEGLATEPERPLIFLNMDGTPGATCLIWEHTMDTPEKRCPNPRIVMPRQHIPNIVDEPVYVDVRSFGTRMPPCTKEKPTYGIMGMFHIIPPALAWIWRLVAPRGFANPSIVDKGGMSSEGVGSYWAFATGKMVEQANLLLDQITSTPETRYILLPNQHVGSYEVGFSAEWITREYLSRKGGVKLDTEDLVKSRCSLLGYSLNSMRIDGQDIRKVFLQPNLQPEIGNEGYDKGAAILSQFFKEQVSQFNKPELKDLGKQIIELVLNDAPIEEYEKIMPMV